MMDQARRDEVLALTRRLVACRSESGHEDGAAAVLREYLAGVGFDEVKTDRYGNAIGVLRGSRPGPRLLFDGHLDTVPVRDASAWTHDPYAGELADGKLYGRGTSDMKGAVAAFSTAAACFLRDGGRDFAGELYLAGVVHEECFEGVASSKISKAVQPDIVVIGEASDLNLKIGQRGRAEIVVETFGKPAHSANPDKGINAVYKMAKVIEEIRKLVPEEHPVLGKGILELTDIKSSPYPGASVVPEYCRCTYDRRLLTGETKESVLAPLQALLDQMMAEDPQLKAKVSYAVGEEDCYTGAKIRGERFFPGWLYEKDDDFVQAAYQQLKADGYDPEITIYNFCTNASHYAGEAGIPTLGMGPSNESQAHVVDEYIELSQLDGVYGCYKSIMKALLK
jgi:putative selenium metabolism hydrolase